MENTNTGPQISNPKRTFLTSHVIFSHFDCFCSWDHPINDHISLPTMINDYNMYISHLQQRFFCSSLAPNFVSFSFLRIEAVLINFSQISLNIFSTPSPVFADTRYEGRPMDCTSMLISVSSTCEGISHLLPTMQIMISLSELFFASCTQ